MIKGKIEFTGETFDDVRDIVLEALYRIRMGHATGHDRSGIGSFAFDVDHDAQD